MNEDRRRANAEHPDAGARVLVEDTAVSDGEDPFIAQGLEARRHPQPAILIDRQVERSHQVGRDEAGCEDQGLAGQAEA